MQQVNMTNEDGVTCLHTASLRGYDRIVSLLLKQCGASANCRTRKSFKTPLHLACQYNHVEVCVQIWSLCIWILMFSLQVEYFF